MEEKGLKLAPIFCSGMILQRDTQNCIYGLDTEAQVVTVKFNGSEYTAKVEENNEFKIILPPVNAGGPYELTVIGSSEQTISDILFGDVYICSGQSNMELPIRRVLRVSKEEVSRTCEPTIRQYHIPATFNFVHPETYMYTSSWKKAIGEDLMDFSAVGYFFAKEIKDTYQVPVGLIMTAVGGSKVESWMNPSTLRSFGDCEKEVEDFKDINYFNTYIQNQQKAAGEWARELESQEVKYQDQEDYRAWERCRIPSLVSDYTTESFQGSVYLCKEVYLEQEPEEATLSMGTIIDSDIIWINGSMVGRTEYRYPPRVYKVPKGLLRKGSNLILIRIVINNKNGGTVKGMPYYLDCDGKQLDLEGEWFYRVGKKVETPMPGVLFPPLLPICFYNTVVVPLSKLAMKGILWYQGESNTGDPDNYADKFAAFVRDWRSLFGWTVPFLYVQLTNYSEPLSAYKDTGWAKIREQQWRNLKLEQVAMAVTLDLGESCDLHPQNKKEIGIRLFQAARNLIYQEKDVISSPLPLTAHKDGNRVMIQFDYLSEANNQEDLHNFELAGPEGKYYEAHAKRIGNRVIVFHEEVSAPTYVRFGWYDNPTDINFYNEYGLPAPCFSMEVHN